MKAIVYHEYGSPDVLELADVDKPAVKDDELLVHTRGAAVAAGDCLMMRGVPYFTRMMLGLRKPKNSVLGEDVAGRVEAVGKNVKQFQPGDEVFGEISGGAFAEYVSVSEDALALKPSNLTFEQAAAGGGVSAFTALQALRKGEVQPGQKVLIIGASGGVGTFAVQIAKALGAEVTGVCSTPNVEMVRSIGADNVIDYTQEDITQSGQQYDLILDIAGNRSLSHFRRALTPQGTLVIVGGSGGPWFNGIGRTVRALVLSPFVRQRLLGFLSMPNKEDLLALKELLETGKVTPVIDRTYRLSEVPEAIRHFEEGHNQGKIVITVGAAE